MTVSMKKEGGRNVAAAVAPTALLHVVDSGNLFVCNRLRLVRSRQRILRGVILLTCTVVGPPVAAAEERCDLLASAVGCRRACFEMKKRAWAAGEQVVEVEVARISRRR